MSEDEARMLKFALEMGWFAINRAKERFECCEDARNTYYNMIQIVADKVGVNLDEVTYCC